jgi:hypothetical protein
MQPERELTMKTERIPDPDQEGRPNEHKPSLKEKAVFQLKEFFGMFLYVWFLLALFDIHQSIILAQEHINYQAQGFAIINALILAKVLLIGEDLHLARELEHKSLAYSILYKSLVFSVLLIGFHIVEEMVVGLIRGRSIAQSFPAAGGGSVQAILSRGAIEFVALIPFFAFREIGRVIGKSELWSLLLTRGTRVYTLQSRPQQ